MKVNFPCAQCDTTVRAELANAAGETPQQVTCSDCGRTVTLAAGAVTDGKLCRCAVCPSQDLFVRKDFPQQLGAAIVMIGLGLSCIPWYFQWWYATYAILFGTALIDLVLYMTMGSVLECYRCRAQYRGVEEIVEHPKFDLETFEKYRQQDARLKQQAAPTAKSLSQNS